MNCHNGIKYIGVWKNDKQNGKGVLYNNNGDRIFGNWKNG